MAAGLVNRRTAKLLGLLGAIFVASGIALGGRGVIAAIIVSTLLLAWRQDGGLGPLFVFALLFLIVMAVSALLLALIAVTH